MRGSVKPSGTNKDGRFCISDFSIFVANSIIGNFEANGVLAFAPTNDDRSFVRRLKKSGQIDKEIVAFNYEDPIDNKQKSQVTVGSIDYSQIEGG